MIWLAACLLPVLPFVAAWRSRERGAWLVAMWALSAASSVATAFWFSRLDVWAWSSAACRPLPPAERFLALSLPIAMLSCLGAFVSALVALLRYPGRRKGPSVVALAFPLVASFFVIEVPNNLQMRGLELVGKQSWSEGRQKCALNQAYAEPKASDAGSIR
ncbi:MAG TPA: hypothetical protein VMK12_28260 [Anaeromyxobacteraceae bacterium]|nr:hypothetical protein [Anaeromyxobacteraceae bacterium]